VVTFEYLAFPLREEPLPCPFNASLGLFEVATHPPGQYIFLLVSSALASLQGILLERAPFGSLLPQFITTILI
jgi:hypothetical protein